MSIKRTGKVIIRKITAIAGDIFKLECTQEYSREGSGGLLAIAMKGHPAFNSKPLVSFQNFYKDQVEAFGLREGDCLNDKLNLEVNIQVNESLVPNQWKNAEGVTQTQKPKTRGENGAIMTENGSPIYRNTSVVVGLPTDEFKVADAVANQTFVPATSAEQLLAQRLTA